MTTQTRDTARVDPLSPMRSIKHLAFVGRKRARIRYRTAKFAMATAIFKNHHKRPWAYRPRRYVDSFLVTDRFPRDESQLPERVFTLWTGENPLPPTRARNLERLRAVLELPVVLVTPENLDDWVVPGSPLHPAYERLSLIHRSDYLRGYLMHHHGGGYTDIKRPVASWRATFEAMRADPDAWVTSYRTSDADWIGKLRGRIGRDILIRHRMMFGKGAFMMRSNTRLTAEWLAEMNSRLDASLVGLQSTDGGQFGTDSYPLGWTDLLGRVLDPLTLKHHKHVRYDERLLLEFNEYR